MHRKSYKRTRGGYRKRFRKFRRSYGAKRSFRRRFRKGYKITKARIKPLYLPDETYLKFKWVGYFAITGSDGATPCIFSFMGNGLEGPNLVAPGTTDLLTDPVATQQWDNFYFRYMVFGSKIQAQIANMTSQSGENYTPYEMFVMPSDVIGPPTDNTFYQMSAMPYVKSRILGPPSGGKNIGTIKHFYTTRKMYQIHGELDQDQYSALFGFNPTKVWYWHVWIGDQMNGDTGITCRVKIQITYYCRIYERINQQYTTNV